MNEPDAMAPAEAGALSGASICEALKCEASVSSSRRRVNTQVARAELDWYMNSTDCSVVCWSVAVVCIVGIVGGVGGGGSVGSFEPNAVDYCGRGRTPGWPNHRRYHENHSCRPPSVLTCRPTPSLTLGVLCPQRFALHFGDVEFLLRTMTPDAVGPFIGVLLQLHCQFFILGRARHFARLAYAVPGRDVWVVLVGLVIVGSAGCGLAVAVLTKTLGNFGKLVPGSTAPKYYTVMLQVWLATSAAVDIILAAVITQSVPPPHPCTLVFARRPKS